MTMTPERLSEIEKRCVLGLDLRQAHRQDIYDLLAWGKAMHEALNKICDGAPETEPERSESSNYGDVEDNAMNRQHFFLAQIARAAQP